MKTATFVRKFESKKGDARLYRLSEPVSFYTFKKGDPDKHTTDHVLVSAAVVPFSGSETYIFPHDGSEKDFEGVMDWGELEGSFRGGLSHAEALEGAGYEVAE